MMAVPGSGKCCYVVTPVLLVLLTGLLYTGCAFRIRDAASPADVCHAGVGGRCSPVASSSSAPSPLAGAATQRAKRPFETVSLRGSFAKSKQRPPDDAAGDGQEVRASPRRRAGATRPWSKLTKIEDVSFDDEEDADSEDEEEGSRNDSDDEIVQIEVEDDDEALVEDDEDDDEESKERAKQEEERRKREREVEEMRLREEERKRKDKEFEEERRRKEEERRRKKQEQEEKLKKQEEERRRKREEERRAKELERKLKAEAEERLREEQEKRLREEEEKKRLKEEEERRLKEKEERKLKEEEERRQKEEEEERKLREEEERRQKEEEERKLREEEERRLKEEEERRLKEEEEQRLREEEELRLKLEEEKLREEEECRLKEEEEERKKAEEERKKKELEEKKRKEKEEQERKRKEKEEREAERKRDAEEDKRRVERLKKEVEEKKLREEKEKKKRMKASEEDEDEVSNGDETEEENDDDDEKPKKKLEKTKPKASSSGSSGSKTKSEKSSSTKKPAQSETKATKPRPRRDAKAPLSLAELNDLILSVPTFVPNFTDVADSACQQHGKIFLRQLRGYKLWALQMLDSSAKIPAGLLRGNVNQLGDFDQCLGIAARVKVEEKTVKVQGKYCLASMDLYATHPAAKVPVNLMQSRALVRGNMRDPGHFIPKFTTVNWALCLPAACSADDARKTIENALEEYNSTIGLKFIVDVDPDMCYVKEKTQSYSKETIGVLYFYVIFICLTIIATLRDYLANLQGKGNYSERIIMAFSLKRTLKALFGNKETSPGDIGCIHGIRSLSTMALYVAHKLIPTSRMPYANRVSLTETAGHPLSSVLRASLFFTDSFLLLSGVLTAYNMTRELTVRNEIRWFCRLIARFVRLTPSLLAVVFWYAFVMEHTGSGPQWNSVVKSNADICKENAWINLLYVQNFFPFEEMCATHTHQLALDMQLSLAAPALVFFLQMKPVLGIIVVFFLMQVSATLRYLATSGNNLSLVVFHGMTLKHLYKTANMTYALPLHRATPYLFGVSLGVLLHYIGKNIRIHKIFLIIGWVLALAVGSWSLFSPMHLAKRDYVYNVEEATHFAVISPIFTALCLSWAIFVCFTDNGGIINRFLSSHWMLVFSRLSYAIYLSQFAVFFYNVGTTRYSSEFQLTKAIDPYEALTVVTASVVLTLLFDIPMQEVKSIIMELGDSQAIEAKDEQPVGEVRANNVRKDADRPVPSTPADQEDELEPGGWNWERGTFTRGSEPREPPLTNGSVDEPYRSSRLKRQDVRRQTMIRSEAYDEWDARLARRATRSEEVEDRPPSRGDYRMDDGDGYLHPRERYGSTGFSRSPMRDLDAPIFRRSASRERPMAKESDISRDYGKKPLITISREEDYGNSRSPRSSVPRFVDQPQRSLSSESESELLNRRSRRSSAEPRVSDEDDWEEEIRIRRARHLHERINSQERDRVPPAVTEEDVAADSEEWSTLRRRSSAEGKHALLREPLRPGTMGLWTVSKMQLGSSQEPDDDDELADELYLQQRREYREQRAPLREEFEEEEEEARERRRSFASESLPTSFEEDDDSASIEFSLKRNSKRITVQDLSKLSSEEDGQLAADNWNKLDVKSPGLFKRESIVKSQASEEDPEYLLPERPKLVEQEQEHPFKKAWQMQKSRSEEEGSAAFAVKESRSSAPPVALEQQKEVPEERLDEDAGQTFDVPEPDVTCDVTIVWQNRSNETDDTRSSSGTATSASARFDDEDEPSRGANNRRKSEDEYWSWTERDT